MAKRFMVVVALALVVAAPAQAGGWKELRVRGVVVSSSTEVVVVENLVGDAVVTCRVPERLAEEASSLEAGDKVRMVCVRKRGERALLVKLAPFAEREEPKAVRGEKGDGHGDGHGEPGRAKSDHAKGDTHGTDEHGNTEQGASAPHAAAVAAKGSVAELAAEAIVVQDAETGRRVACRIPATKSHKLEGIKLGDRVRILCAGGELASLEKV